MDFKEKRAAPLARGQARISLEVNRAASGRSATGAPSGVRQALFVDRNLPGGAASAPALIAMTSRWPAGTFLFVTVRCRSTAAQAGRAWRSSCEGSPELVDGAGRASHRFARPTRWPAPPYPLCQNHLRGIFGGFSRSARLSLIDSPHDSPRLPTIYSV